MTVRLDQALQLLPHQLALVELFFSASSKRTVVLRAPSGLGKRTALLAITQRFLERIPTARVLCLVPGSALRHQFAHGLQELGVPSMEVDRYRFRELLDTATKGSLWPSGVVIVVSREFARKEDVKASLLDTRWDLLLLDEAHRFKSGLSLDLLRQISVYSDRMILVAVRRVKLPNVVRESETTVVTWRRDQIVGLDGRLIKMSARPTLTVVRYALTTGELAISKAVEEIEQILLRSGRTQETWIRRVLLQSYKSSPASLEARLRRLAISPRKSDDAGWQVPAGDAIKGYTGDQNVFVPSFAGAAASSIVHLLRLLEDVDVDSKLESLVGVLRRRRAEAVNGTRIVVLTVHVSTLFYIASELDGAGMPYGLTHGSMNIDDRHYALDRFRTEGEILLSTRAALGGADMRDVTDLVLYDLPDETTTLRQLLDRFDHLGRKVRLNVVGFLQAGAAESSKDIRALQQVLDFDEEE